MELTITLARIIGLFSLIIGIAMLYRKQTILAFIHSLYKHPNVEFGTGAIELLIGTAFITIHWEWRTPLEVIVSIFGLLLFLEGAFYILGTNKVFKRLHKALNLEKFYYAGVIYSISIGVALTVVSFL